MIDNFLTVGEQSQLVFNSDVFKMHLNLLLVNELVICVHDATLVASVREKTVLVHFLEEVNEVPPSIWYCG